MSENERVICHHGEDVTPSFESHFHPNGSVSHTSRYPVCMRCLGERIAALPPAPEESLLAELRRYQFRPE